MQGQEIRAGRVSEREGVQRGGGDRDNMTVVVAERHVQLSDGVIVRRTDAYHPPQQGMISSFFLGKLFFGY